MLMQSEIVKFILVGAILLIAFLAYRLMKLFQKRGKVYLYDENGGKHLCGRAKKGIFDDVDRLFDPTLPSALREVGYAAVDESGFSKIEVKDDPKEERMIYSMSSVGHVDTDGYIYDSNGQRIAVITDLKGRPGINGTSHWWQFHLKRQSLIYWIITDGEVEKVSEIPAAYLCETGRMRKAKPGKYTITAELAAFSMLYAARKPEAEQTPPAYNTKPKWADTALLASLVYMLMFVILYAIGVNPLNIKVLGFRLGFAAGIFVFYFIIWALLRSLETEFRDEGDLRFERFLTLLNRNTNLVKMNRIIMFVLYLAIAFSTMTAFVKAVMTLRLNLDILPLELALLIGVRKVHRGISRQPWPIEMTQTDSDGPIPVPAPAPDDTDPDEPDAVGPETSEERSYHWQLDSTMCQLKGDLTLQFDKQHIEKLRLLNPYCDYKGGFMNYVRQLLEMPVSQRVLFDVAQYINDEGHRAGLSQLDKMQFVLDFVQMPNIQYALDEDCEEIGNPKEYVRFPEETLYDGRGDCDCKAALAAALYQMLGFKVAYVTTRNHAAVAVAFKDAIYEKFYQECGDGLLCKDGYLYFFCETTGDGFRVGDMASVTKSDIEEVYYLN